MKWISVKDGLPAVGQRVYVTNVKMGKTNIHHFIACYLFEMFQWVDPCMSSHEILVPLEVSHWAELPPLWPLEKL